jgi:hypothetical protein
MRSHACWGDTKCVAPRTREAGQEAGKTPIILPVASVKRKLSGSRSGAVGHKSLPVLSGGDRLGGTGEDRRLLVDRNSVPEPFNSKHRRLQLPTTLANEMGGVGIRGAVRLGRHQMRRTAHARSNSHADTSSKLLSVDEMSPAAGTHAAIRPEGLRHVPLAALQLD